MKPQQAKKRLNQLINLGIVLEQGQDVSLTKKFIETRFAYGEKLVLGNGGIDIQKFINEHPNMLPEETAREFLRMASILAIMDMSGGAISRSEVEEFQMICDRLQEHAELQSGRSVK